MTGPKLNQEISFGHIVQIVVLLVGVGIAWANLQGTISLVEARLEGETKQNKLRIDALDGQIRTELRGMNDRLEEVLKRLDRAEERRN